MPDSTRHCNPSRSSSWYHSSGFGGMGLFLANAGRHATPPSIDEAPDVSGLVTMLSRMNRGDPFVPYSEHSRLAWRALLYEGDSVGSVLRGHIASEVLLDALLMLLAWEEGVAAEEAAAWFDASLSVRVRTRYSSRLGGSWDLNRDDQPVGIWSSNVRVLRNRVAHVGVIPAVEEATAALRAVNELADWLKERLIAKSGAYPRTALLFIGQVGFERRDVFRGGIRRFVEEQMPSEPDWLVSFGRWRADFLVARSR